MLKCWPVISTISTEHVARGDCEGIWRMFSSNSLVQNALVNNDDALAGADTAFKRSWPD